MISDHRIASGGAESVRAIGSCVWFGLREAVARLIDLALEGGEEGEGGEDGRADREALARGSGRVAKRVERVGDRTDLQTAKGM